MRVLEETRRVDAAGHIRVDGNAYRLELELAQKEVQLFIDESKIVVTRKAHFIVKLDKAVGGYKPQFQKESLQLEKMPELSARPDPLYIRNNLLRPSPITKFYKPSTPQCFFTSDAPS